MTRRAGNGMLAICSCFCRGLDSRVIFRSIVVIFSRSVDVSSTGVGLRRLGFFWDHDFLIA
ncbi:hypothetical protein MUK42_04365 [Musa troglodytarum]|uniref:Uncharacterized protein n=1 Tax=Musa troglodytarum TaxID=320322 RepID=A0A9E7FBP8_9LILI|nr:hypothetical protein MUK42_04365 [Musa troglodytarum]